MSNLISESMRELIAEQHRREKWGRDGWKSAEEVMAFADKLRARSILDYGCGRGTLKLALKGGGKKIKNLGWFGTVYEYDPAFPKKSRARAAEVVVCTDVLEHIEPEHLDDVLEHIRSLGSRGYYLNISTRAATRDLPDGRNAHLIVQPAEWWLARLTAAGFSRIRHETRGSSLIVWSTNG